MTPERLSFAAVIILAVSTFILLLSQNWRWSIVALAFQYLAVFGLILLVWPVGLAAVKLVSGWMAGAILTASQPGSHLVRDVSPRSSAFLFRLLIALLVWILVISLTPLVLQWIPLPPALVLGSMLLVGMGLLHLGITTRPLRVLLGLLTTLSGFELMYAAVESSVLVAGMLAVVTLGLAMVGAYLFEILTTGKETG